jgi:hypothetical protein
MLKGVRHLNAGFADAVMLKFQLTILDFISNEEVWSYFDEKDPDWLAMAAKRKPPAKSDLRIAQLVSRSGS